MQKKTKESPKQQDDLSLKNKHLTIHKELYRQRTCFNARFFFISLQNIYENDCYYDKGEQGFIYYTRDYSLRFRIRDGQYRQTSTTSYPGKRQRNQNIYAQMGEYQRTQKSIA